MNDYRYPVPPPGTPPPKAVGQSPDEVTVLKLAEDAIARLKNLDARFKERLKNSIRPYPAASTASLVQPSTSVLRATLRDLHDAIGQFEETLDAIDL